MYYCVLLILYQYKYLKQNLLTKIINLLSYLIFEVKINVLYFVDYETDKFRTCKFIGVLFIIRLSTHRVGSIIFYSIDSFISEYMFSSCASSSPLALFFTLLASGTHNPESTHCFM